jgi:hypothetical protein
MKRNMFGNRGLATQVMVTPTSLALEQLQQTLNGQAPLASLEVARSAISMEGMMDSRVRMELETSVDNLQAVIRGAVNSVSQLAKLSVAQEDAAVQAGIAAYAPREFMRRDVPTAAALKAAYADGNTTVIGHSGMSDAMENRIVRMEAFDEKENKNSVAYAVQYNMQAARQDEFGEAFFPTVTVSPDSVGFTVSIRLLYVYDEVRRELNGSLSKFNRKNAIKAIIDPTILRNDQTKIVPVYRKSTPANPAIDTDGFFAADVGSTSVLQDNHTVTTGALAVGKRLDLLAISQTEALLAAGQLDQTDAVDSSIRLAAVYIKLVGKIGGVDTVNVLKFAVDKLPMSDFNAAPQGNTRMMSLNFMSDSLYVTATKKATDGSAPSLLASLGGATVRLGTSMFGTVLQDKGDTTINAGPVEVTKVTDDSGTVLATNAGIGATVAALFANATVVGYDLIAYRTNSNKRQRGQLIDTQYQNYLYTVPLLPPISALRPVGETEANDSALLESLITLTHIRTSNAAVDALLEASDFLKDYVNTKDSITDSPEILGVARYMVTPAWAETELDCATALDSLNSTNRTEDLQNLIINKIRDMAYRLYVSSGYKAALDALYSGAAPKTTVIIGTDPILARYLNLTGDMRTMGDMFDFKLVHTLNQRMTGKIIFSFGMESSFNSGVPNPMHFGNMAWKSELTLMMPMIRNNATAMELTVQPSFRHVVNLPIIGSLNVLNIQSVIASKMPIFTHATP